MPIYEYDCHDCNSQVEVYFRSFTDLERKEAVCPQCQGLNLKRRVSPVTVGNAGKGNVGGQPNPMASTQAGSSHDDPRTLAQTMRRAGQGADRDFNEVATRLERGETATSIEKSLRKRVGESMDVP